jgi:hypothetical protein
MMRQRGDEDGAGYHLASYAFPMQVMVEWFKDETGSQRLIGRQPDSQSGKTPAD